VVSAAVAIGYVTFFVVAALVSALFMISVGIAGVIVPFLPWSFF
jgi:hypothetical protein